MFYHKRCIIIYYNTQLRSVILDSFEFCQGIKYLSFFGFPSQIGIWFSVDILVHVRCLATFPSTLKHANLVEFLRRYKFYIFSECCCIRRLKTILRVSSIDPPQNRNGSTPVLISKPSLKRAPNVGRPSIPPIVETSRDMIDRSERFWCFRQTRFPDPHEIFFRPRPQLVRRYSRLTDAQQEHVRENKAATSDQSNATRAVFARTRSGGAPRLGSERFIRGPVRIRRELVRENSPTPPEPSEANRIPVPGPEWRAFECCTERAVIINRRTNELVPLYSVRYGEANLSCIPRTTIFRSEFNNNPLTFRKRPEENAIVKILTATIRRQLPPPRSTLN